MPDHPKAHPASRRRKSAEAAAPLIRLVIADHHAIDRGGLVGLIENEPDMVVVGEAATVAEVLVQCRALRPDVLVLTMNLPDQAEEPALLRLRRELPDLRVLAMSDRGTHNCVVLNPPSRQRGTDQPVEFCPVGTDCLALAVAQGARATLRRSADPEDLFRGIRAVSRGQSWFDPTTTSELARGIDGHGPASGESNEPLSERELDVAALLAEGLSNKEISSALSISEPTVKKHVAHILEKLRLQDRLQAGLHIARNPLLIRRPASPRATSAPAPPPARAASRRPGAA